MEAVVGTKDYAAYSVKLQLIAKATGRFQVSPGNFFPPPRVTSSVIRLDRRNDLGLSAEEIANASMAADAAFFTRRKTISNSMKGYFSSRGEQGKAIAAKLPEILAEAGIDAKRRGETLELSEFVELGRVLAKAKAEE